MKSVKIFLILFALFLVSANAFGAQVSLPALNAEGGQPIDIPVNIDNASGLAAYQFTVSYNAAVLTCTTAVNGTLTGGWDSPTVNATIPGQIALLSTDPNLAELPGGSGSLAILKCTAANNPGGSTSLHFSEALLSNGNGDPLATVAVDGTFTISGGTCVPSDEICDGIDNDCDGQVDEGLTRPTTCGIGACAATGTETCTAGTWGGDTCTPGTPGIEGPVGDATCTDAADNDCDGTIDDSDSDCGGQCVEGSTRPTTCGIGACAATGTETCTAGTWGGDTCTPGTPGIEGPVGDATCTDAADNDCDGLTDSSDTDCGGECIPSAEVCDGIDNDCDGQVDEDITPVPTSCGLGACAATGTAACVNGQVIDSCIPGTPGTEGPAGDATCSDMVDNDCDGATDGSDSNCMAQQLPDMSQWTGNWFKIKVTVNCTTFNEPDASFGKEKSVAEGYMHFGQWDANTGALHFDYYEEEAGVWGVFSDMLHFFAGTPMQFLFWYDAYDDTVETA
ncbi:MAG: cohesin domain-containing protein, partial [Pseudomonadota bacterium]